MVMLMTSTLIGTAHFLTWFQPVMINEQQTWFNQHVQREILIVHHTMTWRVAECQITFFKMAPCLREQAHHKTQTSQKCCRVICVTALFSNVCLLSLWLLVSTEMCFYFSKAQQTQFNMQLSSVCNVVVFIVQKNAHTATYFQRMAFFIGPHMHKIPKWTIFNV